MDSTTKGLTPNEDAQFEHTAAQFASQIDFARKVFGMAATDLESRGRIQSPDASGLAKMFLGMSEDLNLINRSLPSSEKALVGASQLLENFGNWITTCGHVTPSNPQKMAKELRVVISHLEPISQELIRCAVQSAKDRGGMC